MAPIPSASGCSSAGPLVLLAILVAGGCHSDPAASECSAAVAPLGDCVLESPSGSVPADLRGNTGLVHDGRYAPFTKHVTVCGFLLLGGSDVSDRFMIDVAAMIEGMFAPETPGIDRDLQDRLLRTMYERRTAIPFFLGDEPEMPDEEDWQAFDRLNERLSICDVIFELDDEDRRGQPMEVIEHVLHHLNMVGLHFVFPDEWGISSSSRLHAAMQEATDRDFYNVEYLDEFDDEDEALRVLLQEYAYWVISTEWDLQVPYGGDWGGGEWTLADPVRFRRAQPDLHEVFARTIPRVVIPPTRELLDRFRSPDGR